MLIREQYISRLKALREFNVIKVLIGLRRSGKSTILRQFADALLGDGVSAKQIQFYNFEEEENEALFDRRALLKKINAGLAAQGMNYIFLDEVQNISEFEKLIDALFAKDNVDVYITGSNAYMLSSEIATILSGRYVEIPVYPFSFGEFVRTLRSRDSLPELFNTYMQYGSLPEVTKFINRAPEQIGLYLNGVFNTVVRKDIEQRHSIRNRESFANVIMFLFDSVGSQVSAHSISKP
jgi:predicted AAA+ superfamily ATPase